jgi:hypothetical protein
MSTETIISLAALLITVLSAVGGAAAFLIRVGGIQNQIEEQGKKTNQLCEDLEGGLKSVREDAKKMEMRIVTCESTAQLTGRELHHLTQAIEANTLVTARLSDQIIRMEEREKARDRRPGQP